MHYQHLSFLALGGLIPGPTFTKIGDDLLPTQVYQASKFVLPNFITLRQTTPEISVTKNFTDKERNKETVNDISPVCLSACGDKNAERAVSIPSDSGWDCNLLRVAQSWSGKVGQGQRTVT